MKHLALSIGFLLLALASWAVPTGVVYTEGEADVRLKSGVEREASIGDILNTGDTVKTGGDGYVELDQKGLTLRISRDTVFTLLEKEQKGQPTGVLSLAVGSVKFRYGKLTGREPLIHTSSCTAGVRGTELEVFAGVDGSTLIVVEQGAGTVEAEGESVDLSPAEAVEIPPGRPPGEKFTVQRGQIDYGKWNDQKLEAMLADPDSALAAVNGRMEYYIENILEYDSLYKENKLLLEAARKKQEEIFAAQGQDEARRHDKEVVAPLALAAFNQSLNVRYFALAALSLRRYVGGRMYLYQKLRHIASAGAEPSLRFSAVYDDLLKRFEENVVPYLGEAEI